MSPKLRGGRRYYARLRREVQTLLERVNAGEEFSMWHHHFDHRGFGCGRATIRRRHLQILVSALAKLSQCERVANGQLQAFASIAPADDSSEDALYLHSDAWGALSYPYCYPEVRWDARPPVFLRRS